VASAPYADPTQFDKESEYFDPKATKDNPRWMLVDVKFEKDLERLLSLDEIRNDPGLKEMRLLQKGNRLSILPVTPDEFEKLMKLI
jgi:predicted RNA-binding protein with PUA-like domain